MKYPYSKFLFWGLRVMCFVICGLMGYILSESVLLALLFSVILNSMFFLTEVKKSSEKYIELHDETIRFSNHGYGHRYARGFLIPYVTFDVKFKDIFIIKVKKLPLIGIYAVVLEANEKEYKIKIYPHYCNFKDMYINLCKKVKEHNPDVYIDGRLLKYIEE